MRAGPGGVLQGREVLGRREAVTVESRCGGVHLGGGAMQHPDQSRIVVAAAVGEMAGHLARGEDGLQGQPFETLTPLEDALTRAEAKFG